MHNVNIVEYVGVNSEKSQPLLFWSLVCMNHDVMYVLVTEQDTQRYVDCIRELNHHVSCTLLFSFYRILESWNWKLH